jgi:hypothetical protein
MTPIAIAVEELSLEDVKPHKIIKEDVPDAEDDEDEDDEVENGGGDDEGGANGGEQMAYSICKTGAYVEW